MRKLLLTAAAAATLIAAWFAPDSEGGVVSAAAARSGTAANPASPATLAPIPRPIPDSAPASGDDLRASLHIAPRIEEEELGNLFAKQSWGQPATGKQLAQAATAAAAAIPVTSNAQPAGAPALPIQFLGRYSDDGKTAYFLQMDGQNLLARAGERVTDQYLLEAVEGNRLIFIYLPLNQKQILAVGDTN